MGEMTDFFLEDVVEMEEKRSRYYNSNMSDEEAFEHGFLSPNGSVLGMAGEPEDYTDLLTYEEALDNINNLESSLICGRSLESKLKADFIAKGGQVIDFKASNKKEYAPLLDGVKEIEWFEKNLLEHYSVKTTALMVSEIKDAMQKKILIGKTTEMHSLKKNFPFAFEAIKHLMEKYYGTHIPDKPKQGVTGTNYAAVQIAQKSEVPYCNCCQKPMDAKIGKYGKFYFCKNQCKEQKTVSDSYWQKYKQEVAGIKNPILNSDNSYR
jgi:hypothetical protein